MKIKLDENLPESLLSALAALGHEVDNVRQEASWARCFVLLTDVKLRIHRPAS